MKRLGLVWVFVLASVMTRAQAAEILDADFGLFDASNPRELVFESTRTVPLREGQRYGWIVQLRTKQRSVAVREEYVLPNAGTEAGPRGDLKRESTLSIPLPRRSQVSQRQLTPIDGRIFGEWAVGPGDPPGRRHLQVIVEGEVAASFEYEVK
jgi:hypothetical protein